MMQYFSTILDWYMANINYWTVTLLMSIESSFLPLPSEFVIPPAGWKAAQGEMNIFIIVLCAVTGSCIGASFNYCLALWLGKPIIYKLADTKLAHLMLINREAVQKAENYFIRYGKSATFIGRLVPAVRHLISIPAGLSKMNFRDFIIYTAFGSAIWNAILAVLGYFLYTQKELLNKYFQELWTICLVLGIIFIIYVLIKTFLFTKKRKQ